MRVWGIQNVPEVLILCILFIIHNVDTLNICIKTFDAIPF